MPLYQKKHTFVVATGLMAFPTFQSMIQKSTNLLLDIENILHLLSYDKLFILTDEHTKVLCLPLLEFNQHIREATLITVSANDSNKTLDSLAEVWKALSAKGATRHSLLINLGGGMVTDLGGFASATFKRGITYINVPTTLLGAVDAAVGGKTGINFGCLKNEIGAFYPAHSVLISTDFFHTLSKEAILSGYAEMLKHALIFSRKEWEKLIAFSFDPIDFKQLNELLFHSVNIKQQIVLQDPLEKNVRKALNLGHTIGHAFESFAMEQNRPIPHGYAVAWGLIAELYLSHRVCGFPRKELRATVRFIQQRYGAFLISCNDYDALYQLLTHDKKNKGDVINFSLLRNIGEVEIDQEVDKELIFEALDFYRDSVGL